jgi:hypothetical protein
VTIQAMWKTLLRDRPESTEGTAAADTDFTVAIAYYALICASRR